MRSSFKKITSKEELRSRIDAELPTLMQNFPEDLQSVIRTYNITHISFKAILVVVLLVVAFLTLVFTGSHFFVVWNEFDGVDSIFQVLFSNYVFAGFLIVSLLLFGVAFNIYRSSSFKLNYFINKVFLPHIIKIYNLRGHFIEQPYKRLASPSHLSKKASEYDSFTNEGKKICDLIHTSQLQNEKDKHLRIDSILSIEGLSADELISAEIEYVYIQGERTIISSFKGYFFAINLRSESLNHSVILLERLKTSLMDRFLVRYEILEPVPTDPDEEFDDVLSVLSTNHTELEAFLDNDTRLLLKQMWRESNGIIRISFDGTYMYMFYGCPKVRIGSTVMAVTENNLKSYMYDAASPLSNIFEFVEKVVSYTQAKK